MKKIFATLMALVMLVSCLGISAFAATPITFSGDNVTAKAGDAIEFKVNVVSHTGVSAARIQVSCDAFKEIEEIETGAWCAKYMASVMPNEDNGKFNWAYTKNVSVDRNPSGVFATYYVNLKNDLQPGTYTITIASEDILQFDADGVEKTLPGETVKATLTIEGDPVVDPEQPGTDEPGTTDPEQPGTDEPGTTDPEQPGTDEPGTTDPEQPGTDEPGTTDPEPDEPGTTDPEQPGTDEPGTTDPEQPGENQGTDKPADKPAEENKKDDATNTNDITNMIAYMVVCLFAAAAIVVVSFKLKKNRG